jgi:hypothetical protein
MIPPHLRRLTLGGALAVCFAAAVLESRRP